MTILSLPEVINALNTTSLPQQKPLKGAERTKITDTISKLQAKTDRTENDQRKLDAAEAALNNTPEHQRSVDERERQKILSNLVGDVAKDDHVERATRLAKLKQYLQSDPNYQQLGKLLFHDYQLSQTAPAAMNDEQIKQAFDELNSENGYFQDDRKAFIEFKKCYKACHYIDQVIENGSQKVAIPTRAYKMMVLFYNPNNPEETLKKVTNFIRQKLGENLHTNRRTGAVEKQYPNPVHDLLLYDIPPYKDNKENQLNLADWQTLINVLGMEVVKVFESAHDIKMPDNKVPQTATDFSKSMVKFLFPRAEENSDLAFLCYHYGSSERTFNRGLDLIKDGTIKLKTNGDTLPDVVIGCKDIDQNKKDYYLVRLPAADMRGLILGDITNCCQSVNNVTEKCVIDGMNDDDKGFYVLIQANTKTGPFDPKTIDWKNFEKNGHKILGEGYCWRGKHGAFAIHSWENLIPKSDDKMMLDVLKNFAQQVVELSNDTNPITRVIITKGGKTPNDIRSLPNGTREFIKTGYMYDPGSEQVELFAGQKLQDLRGELSQKSGIADQSHIISFELAAKLNPLSPDALRGMGANYHGMTTHLMEYNGNDIENNIKLLNNLAQSDKLKFIALIQPNAIKAYKAGVRIQDLAQYDAEKIKTLTAGPGSSETYKAGVTIHDLAPYDAEKIEALTSEPASETYKDGVTIHALAPYDAEKIKALTTYGARMAYKAGIKVQDLAQYNNITIEALTSAHATMAYKAGIEIKDLAKCDNKKIKLLTSFNAINAYKAGIEFKDLAQYDAEKIKALTSKGAIKVYQEDKAKFKDLEQMYDSNKKKFLSLTSEGAIELYNKGNKFDDLAQYDYTKIDALTTYYAIEAYKAGIEFKDLAQYDTKKIQELTLWYTTEAYKAGVTIQDLAPYDAEKVKALTSPGAIKVYQKDKAKFKDLEQMYYSNTKKFLSLTSEGAIELYNKGNKFDDLAQYDYTKIDALTTYGAIKAYETGVTIHDLAQYDAEKIKLLTSVYATEAYKARIKVHDLAQYDKTKIKALTSEGAIELYNTRNKFDDLAQYDYTKIDALTTYYAIEAYKAGIEFKDLAQYDAEKIKALTSPGAIKVYQEDKAKFKDLEQMYDSNKKKFLSLTSEGAIALYNKGNKFENVAKTYDFNKNKFIAMCAAALMGAAGLVAGGVAALANTRSKTPANTVRQAKPKSNNVMSKL